MPEINSLAIFITAAIIMLITPGPAVLYIVARSMEQGWLAGLVSTLGIAGGGLFHVLFAAFGLSVLLVQSAIAFSVVKYLGAGYLIYLGISRAIRKEDQGILPIKKAALPKIFIQGFVVNLLNPKTALFFMAFLPQFVDPRQGAITTQILYLGMIFIALAVMSDGIYALAASSLSSLITKSKAVHFFTRYIPSGIYVGLGIWTLFLKNSRT